MIALAERPSATIRASLSSRIDMPAKQDETAYYQRRIAQCAELAAHATCPSVRFAHQELARLYGEKLDELGLVQAPQMEADLQQPALVTSIASARGDAS